MTLITQSEYARRQGFSRQYVNKLIKEGKIMLENGMIDEDQANVALENQRNQNIPLYRTGESTYKNTGNINELLARARLKNEIEKGKILEAKAKAEIGQFVSVKEVKKAAFSKARIVRDRILDIPDKISVLLATIDDSSQIHEILTSELRDVLEKLSWDSDDENI